MMDTSKTLETLGIDNGDTDTEIDHQESNNESGKRINAIRNQLSSVLIVKIQNM